MNDINTKSLQYTIWIFIVVSMLIGGLLGTYIIGKETGEFSIDLMIPIIVGTIGGMVIYILISKWNAKRNGKVPEVDERTIKNLQRYFLLVLYIILVGSGATLLIVYAMGIETIETGLLIICLCVIFLITGLGSVIVKRF